jgi:hypothetical protein
MFGRSVALRTDRIAGGVVRPISWAVLDWGASRLAETSGCGNWTVTGGFEMTFDGGLKPEGAPERSPIAGAGAPSGVDAGPKRYSALTPSGLISTGMVTARSKRPASRSRRCTAAFSGMATVLVPESRSVRPFTCTSRSDFLTPGSRSRPANEKRRKRWLYFPIHSNALSNFRQALDAFRASSWLDAGPSGGGAYPRSGSIPSRSLSNASRSIASALSQKSPSPRPRPPPAQAYDICIM